ncbi:hypothetical protein Goklo_029073 [Gossypium klotzschianum]|uniref:Uncharacterized protein n=1 Tax=Gossypium klotzschianum TaxID=34286 RepID=A0A7J8W6Y0_9ROSI|nr:hypothetical protein [Gossypium klotzschianum]
MEEEKMNLRLNMDVGSSSNPGNNPANPVISILMKWRKRKKLRRNCQNS